MTTPTSPAPRRSTAALIALIWGLTSHDRRGLAEIVTRQSAPVAAASRPDLKAGLPYVAPLALIEAAASRTVVHHR